MRMSWMMGRHAYTRTRTYGIEFGALFGVGVSIALIATYIRWQAPSVAYSSE
jgi:hypothetical protein